MLVALKIIWRKQDLFLKKKLISLIFHLEMSTYQCTENGNDNSFHIAALLLIWWLKLTPGMNWPISFGEGGIASPLYFLNSSFFGLCYLEPIFWQLDLYTLEKIIGFCYLSLSNVTLGTNLPKSWSEMQGNPLLWNTIWVLRVCPSAVRCHFTDTRNVCKWYLWKWCHSTSH